MKRACLIIANFVILLAGCSPAAPMAKPAQTPVPSLTQLPSPSLTPTVKPNVLYVDPTQDLGPISPYVYGANISMFSMIPAGQLQTAYDAHITAMRAPGGGWGEMFDLSPFQLDLLIGIIKKMGALPTMSVRLKGGTPEKAAALVRYANIEQGDNIIYWSIGNEPNDRTGAGMIEGTASFNQQWRAIALAMKAVDPKIKLMGPELSQWGTNITNTPKYPSLEVPTTNERQDWMTDFLKANGDLVDVVTVHRYPFYPADKVPVTVERVRQNSLEWGIEAAYLHGLIHQITGRDLPIGFTEVNSFSGNIVNGVATPDSLYNAIWYADVLGRLIDQNVFMVNYWDIGGNDGYGLISSTSVRPAYYVFQMYNQFGSERVYSSSGVNFVSVYAAKRKDGTLTLMVINLTDGEQHVPLQFQGVQPTQAEVWRFDATHNAEDMGQQTIPAEGLDLPAQSITLYAIGGK